MRYAIVTLIVVIAIIVVVSVLASQPMFQQGHGPLSEQGDWTTRTAPDFTDRWTLLAFFVPDRNGCEQEIPLLKDLQSRYEQHGLSVVGVTLIPRDEAQDYAKEYDFPCPIFADAAAEFEIYGVREVPDSFLVDPQGVVVARGMNFIEAQLLKQFDK